MSVNYEEKYLKYKNKYITLRKQNKNLELTLVGGNSAAISMVNYMLGTDSFKNVPVTLQNFKQLEKDIIQTFLQKNVITSTILKKIDIDSIINENTTINQDIEKQIKDGKLKTEADLFTYYIPKIKNLIKTAYAKHTANKK